MTRDEAIQKLSAEEYRVAPGQSYEVGRLEPQDAWGVARCFFVVYGAEYPIDTGYIPERLIEENARGNIYSAIARTPAGDVVGYGALYRSSSPNPKAYELGQYIILPEYRHGLMIAKLTSLLVGRLAPDKGVEIVFGESVCHHLSTQKLGRLTSSREAAIEIGLMPAAAYPREDFPNDRVSALLQFKTLKDRPQTVYFPNVYREWLDYILSGMEIDRTVQPATAEAALADTRFTEQYFGFAGVLRSMIQIPGRDFDAHVSGSEQRFLPQGARVLQFYINLGEPPAAGAVEVLRSRGYFFGGYLPGWFGTDGLLMQKVLDLPDFRSIKLYSDRARKILEFIQADLGR